MKSTLLWLALAFFCCSQSLLAETVLRASLFPYVIDAADDRYEALTEGLERRFEEAYPDIDLQLTIDPSFDAYNLGVCVKVLCQDLDVLQVDTLMLRELESVDILQPWPETVDRSGWHPATKSVTQNRKGELLAVPHLLCGYFLMTRDPEIHRARSADELITAITLSGIAKLNLTANFSGTWNLPSIYVDAWRESHPKAPVEHAVSAVLDAEVVATLRRIVSLVARDGSNPGLDGTFSEEARKAYSEFGSGKSKAFVGYSESLHGILLEGGDRSILVGVAPVGEGIAPVLFVDGFVLKRDVSPEVRDAAVHFVNFMNDPKTMDYFLMSRDAKEGTPPRYILPANQNVFLQPAFQSDPLYSQLGKAVQGAVAFPNHDFYLARYGMAELLRRKLEARHGPGKPGRR
jgi:thiamine pyridinylase